MRYIIKKIRNHNGQLLQQIESDNANDIPHKRTGWGEVHEGWYNQTQIDKLNKELLELNIPLIEITESTPRRITTYVDGFASEEIDEFFLNPNYSIDVIDSESESYKKQNYSILRRKEYPSVDELIVALWESIVESNDEAKNLLQAKKEAIKLKYPKP